MTRHLLVSLVALGGLQATVQAQPSRTVEFNRDIRPILSENCFVCHGPDNNLRKADLRLDVDKGLFDDKDGVRILVPGDPMGSELFKRLIHDKRSQRMPPAKAMKELTKDQIELVRLWIEQGAKYQGHWSLLPPRKVALPQVKNKAANAIDRFILAKLEHEGIRPAAEADRRALIRRLSFDLTGLPPTPAQVDAFLADNTPTAYEKLVDRLLASPHFGERMAVYWLDLVRYADTKGYHFDEYQNVFPYRDWVIEAFNANKPFDQFTIEQLAGDLLPKATEDQKIASGYNRILPTSREGCADPKEFQAKFYADRVRNFSSVWLGSTFACCECHDHKFDPFPTKDFYSLEAFFADIDEEAALVAVRVGEKGKMIEDELIALREELQKLIPEAEESQAKWEEDIRLNKIKPPAILKQFLDIEPAKRSDDKKEVLANYYRHSIYPPTKALHKKLEAAQSRWSALVTASPNATLITSTTARPRTIRVLPGGDYLDQSGEIVLPATPAVLPKLDVNGRRADRLDLARWTMRPDNPLPSRVFVNRLWMLYFGQGLVKTLDDFGAQGSWPTHPELLDWLAVEFRANGWNIKHMIKLMVMSNTYRQASAATDALKQRDPYNQLYARQASFRLDAEHIRDNALTVAGLLSPKIGGRSTLSYPPAGYLALLVLSPPDWKKDGKNQYRRGLYTYWQRTSLHPSLLAFDAPSREECTVARPRSNTPQQALVLLNDPTYVEAARVFAQRILQKGGATTEQRIQYAVREALQRPVQAEEVKILDGLVEKHLARYRTDVTAAKALVRVGDSPVPADLDPADLAAWTSVARVILNLHEAITRN